MLRHYFDGVDNDFDDPIEEDTVVPDQPNHMMPGVPMPNVGQVPAPQPPPNGNDFRPPSGGAMGGSGSIRGTGKIRFEILEGEYYEKGKPRGRAPVTKR